MEITPREGVRWYLGQELDSGCGGLLCVLPIRLLAAAAWDGGACAGRARPRHDHATFGGTTIWVGGGVQFLSLPDIRFTGKAGRPSPQKNSESDWLDFGGAAGGGIETALGFWGGYRVTGGIKGFWANVETDDRTALQRRLLRRLRSGRRAFAFEPPTLVTKTDRDADYWGSQAELKFGQPEPVHVKPTLYRNDYFIVGADVRGIDQNNTLHGSSRAPDFTYKESLDTTYFGGYIGFGGEYSFGFIPGCLKCRRTLRPARPAHLHQLPGRALRRQHRL